MTSVLGHLYLAETWQWRGVTIEPSILSKSRCPLKHSQTRACTGDDVL